MIQMRCGIALPVTFIKKKTNDSMFLQIFFKFVKKTSVEVRGRKPSALPKGLCRQFSLSELQAATNNFDDDLKIGESRFGRVYRGIINGGTLVVAVKRLSGPSSGPAVEVFRNEVQLLCQLRHQNLVSLIGFCYEKDERILVYEHMIHRGLDGHLFRNANPLPWKQRLEICIGAARGLHYLHAGAKYAIIHRNVNPSNILLDENWVAKLSDFGLSKIGPASMSKPKPNALTKTESIIAGTYGYLAPEYAINGELSEKHDVYSLGVVLFEVLGGRSQSKFQRLERYDMFLWIWTCIKDSSIQDIIDPCLKGKIAPLCLIEFVEIALSCIHGNPNKRPSMGEVEATLELALELQEKADSVMKADNSHAGYVYEDVSFRVSVEDYGLEDFWCRPANRSSGESVESVSIAQDWSRKQN